MMLLMYIMKAPKGILWNGEHSVSGVGLRHKALSKPLRILRSFSFAQGLCDRHNRPALTLVYRLKHVLQYEHLSCMKRSLASHSFMGSVEPNYPRGAYVHEGKARSSALYNE